jgi:tRNA/rRNA methyltransferase
MNLGQAVAVCLYELARDPKRVQQDTSAARASGAQLERAEQLLLDALAASGYIKPGASPSTEEKLRLLLRRMQFSTEDAETWTGMLRKISGRLQRGSSKP